MKFGIGQSVLRVEDARLVTGAGRYTDDIQAPDMLYGVTVRSPYGHARLLSIDTQAALAIPGVVAVYTAEDVDYIGEIPCLVVFNQQAQTPHKILVHDVVRHVGDGVAFVVAQSREAARLGAENVVVEYEELPAIASIDEALQRDAALVWPHSPGNIPFTWTAGEEEATKAALAKAAHITRIRVAQPRVAPTSMEVRAALAQYSQEDGFTLTTGSQGVANMRQMLAHKMFNIPPEQVRVVTHDVGGGFGMKTFIYPEYALCMHAARALGQSVKWTGDRSDAFLTDMMGRDLVSDGVIGLDSEGKILAISVETWFNLGAYQGQYGPAIQTAAGGKMIGGVYNVPALFNKVHGVFTNTTPTDAYRGAGRPEACYITERLIEAAAREIGMASDEIRRRNLLKPEALPHKTMLGVTFDVGNFPAVLEKALQSADWDGFSARAEQSQAKGLLRGRGLCFYVEIASGGSTEEFADARILDNGIIEVAVGTQSNGQGHETAYAQIVAARLGVDFAQVRIVQGDTNRLSTGHGTGGSRSLQFGGSACLEAAQGVIDKGKSLAIEALEANDIGYGTNRTISLFELARRYPRALDTSGHYKVSKPTPVFPNGCHVCEVEIDPETGSIDLVKYTVVDDFGVIINPMLVQGQVHGGIAQGLGQVLIEEMRYGEGAQLLTGSFMDYGVVRADEMPFIAFDTLPVANPNNPLGAKGCGEAGTIGALASAMHAILDALRPYGVTHLDMPATPQTIYRALKAQSAKQAA
jgi:aerobic carbon-monoxide dehydrogenase large subunit